VLIDATIVRVALVPSTMVLLGDRNWWMPDWLGRLLPHLDIEGEAGLPDPNEPDDPAEVTAGLLLLLMLVRQIEHDASRVDAGGAPTRLLAAAAELAPRTVAPHASAHELALRARRAASTRLTPLAAARLSRRRDPLGGLEPPPGRPRSDHTRPIAAGPATERTDRADS
jgi:hypothetical protein